MFSLAVKCIRYVHCSGFGLSLKHHRIRLYIAKCSYIMDDAKVGDVYILCMIVTGVLNVWVVPSKSGQPPNSLQMVPYTLKHYTIITTSSR